jgi:mono/diheme cytochrome c family protein
MNMHRIYATTAAIALVALTAACNWDKSTPGYVYMDDMYRSPSLEAYQPATQFADGLSARQPVAGTVSRGEVPYGLPNTNEAYELSKRNGEVPASFAALNADEGKELYLQFCSHCHGEKGDGNGILMQREKILGVPGYGSDRLPDITPGSVYHVIMHGKNNMGSHASQLHYDERWKIIKYVFQLRAEQNGGAPAAPAADTTATAAL